MFYNAELSLLKDTFAKCRLSARVVTADSIKKLKSPKNKAAFNAEDILWMRPSLLGAKCNTFYRLSDRFGCRYIFVMLPELEEDTYFIIGPYVTGEQTAESFLEKASRAGISPRQALSLKDYYSAVPRLSEDSAVFALLDSFGELIFGGAHNFSLVDIELENASLPSPITEIGGGVDDVESRRLSMEKRYQKENELMEAVRQGLVNRAELILSGFQNMPVEQRLSDPIRNLKNYCIIMNTLLRKAAESGGVHPLYLDSISSDFARKIEQLSDTDDIRRFMGEMFRSYCRLVRKHSMKNYSPPIARTIILIDSDLTADLSLSTLAKSQEVSSGYLSALFRREVGQTLTDFVNSRRIKLAMKLLKTTSLQVQAVAQHCGILDIHYFSRIFKKYAGVTPKEYRDS